MHPVVVATADEGLLTDLFEELRRVGRIAEIAGDWASLVALVARPTTRVALIDGRLPGADGDLLARLGASLGHRPALWTVGAPLPPLAPTPDLASAVGDVTPELPAEAAAVLPWWGLAPDGAAAVRAIAASPLPVCVHGERGTGKEWIARLAASLATPGGPFTVHKPGDDVMLRAGRPGTVYLDRLELHDADAVANAVALAAATGWRVLGGARKPPSAPGWTHVTIRPLRDRPRDLRRLAQHWLDSWRVRLGLPRQKVAASLWARMERHAWPGNQRELETFVVQAATSTPGRTLAADTLPPRVMALLDPSFRAHEETEAFEAMAEQRLRPVVIGYVPGDGASLHRMVLDATERALLRLVLQRTAGNQKAAAHLLGVARNTLRARIERLHPRGEDA